MPDIIQRFDVKILFYIQNHFHNGFMDKLMIIATFMGNSLIWFIICAFLLLSKKHRRVVFMVICAFLLSSLLSEHAIKYIFHRPRPFELYPHDLLISKPANYSFPSTHATQSFAVGTVLFVSIKKYGFIFIILAIMIAFSRLYLFVHFPSDIIAGTILGITCAYISLFTLNSSRFKSYLSMMISKLPFKRK